MRKHQDLEIGIVYWVQGFTAPKVFNGLYFECLLTDQKIAANYKAKSTGTNIVNWTSEIYKPERFNLPNKQLTK